MSVSNISTHIQTGGPATNQPLQKGTERTRSTLQEIGGEYCSINDAYFGKSRPQAQLVAQQRELPPKELNQKYSLSYKEKNEGAFNFLERGGTKFNPKEIIFAHSATIPGDLILPNTTTIKEDDRLATSGTIHGDHILANTTTINEGDRLA